MKANGRFLMAIVDADGKQKRHRMSTVGRYQSDAGPALQVTCSDCGRRIFQFSNGSVAGTASERECGDRVPAK